MPLDDGVTDLAVACGSDIITVMLDITYQPQRSNLMITLLSPFTRDLGADFIPRSTTDDGMDQD